MRIGLISLQSLFVGLWAGWAAELDRTRFRLVWNQAQENPSDVHAVGNNLSLRKYDSTVGREEKLLAEIGNYSNPMLCPDGDWVVYSDRRDNTIYKVPFAGGTPEQVAEGFAVELWRDPATDEDTVFVAGVPKGFRELPAWWWIGRTPLHGDGTVKEFWKATGTMANNFQLSADGKVASGQFPWPIGGLALPAMERWVPLDRGCWPSLAPDNSYLFWQFDGLHRNVTMHDPVTRKQWIVNLNGAPGIHGFEVYHPRWSNHPRHMVFTGPYREGPGGNKIRQGGSGVEVYIGTFAEDFTRMESFRKITENERGDFYPDLWVEGGDQATSGFPQHDGFWCPEKTPEFNLYFGWESARFDNRHPNGSAMKPLQLFDDAYLGPNHELVLRGRGGHANPRGDHFVLRDTVRLRKAWTFESVFTSALDRESGRMFGYTQRNGHVNVWLDQVKDEVFITMNVVGDPVRFPLGRIERGVPLHVIVTVDDRTFRAWLNGRLVEKTLEGAPFWGQGSLIWGEQQGYGSPWKGTVSHMRLITRDLPVAEVEARMKWVRPQLEERIVPERYRVKARLLEASSTSELDQIAPYTNELSAGAFEWVEDLEGKFPARRFAAYSFSILNRKPNPDYPGEIGKVYTLELEPFDKQPQFRSELRSNDLEDVTLESFLALP